MFVQATPNGIVEIGVTAVSLLGSAVGGAEVNLKWSINGQCFGANLIIL